LRALRDAADMSEPMNSDPVHSDPAPPPHDTIPYASPPAAPLQQARTWAMFCHLSALVGFLIPFGNVIGPLIIWQIKKVEFPIVDDQGKESLNFQITMLLAALVSVALVAVFIGVILLPIVGLTTLILTIIGGIKANEGAAYRYPICIRFIK